MTPSTTTGVFSTWLTLGNRETSTAAQAGDIGLVDLRQRRVAIAAGIAVIGRPVVLRGDHAIAVGRELAQKMNALIIRQKLQIGHALIEHTSSNGFSIRCLNSFSDDG